MAREGGRRAGGLGSGAPPRRQATGRPMRQARPIEHGVSIASVTSFTSIASIASIERRGRRFMARAAAARSWRGCRPRRAPR
ncbi:hypothetical protein PPH41_25175, partial [Burkholderia gladioli]|nr:hypothetical protein [Burkholderia gladioli]